MSDVLGAISEGAKERLKKDTFLSTAFIAFAVKKWDFFVTITSSLDYETKITTAKNILCNPCTLRTYFDALLALSIAAGYVFFWPRARNYFESYIQGYQESLRRNFSALESTGTIDIHFAAVLLRKLIFIENFMKETGLENEINQKRKTQGTGVVVKGHDLEKLHVLYDSISSIDKNICDSLDKNEHGAYEELKKKCMDVKWLDEAERLKKQRK